MGVPLEVSIARLIGDPTHLKEQPEFYPESTAVYVVCPECKREMEERETVDCYGTVVNALFCEIHGKRIPMKSAVVTGLDSGRDAVERHPDRIRINPIYHLPATGKSPCWPKLPK